MKRQIVILGGGFAGVESAIKLKKFGYDVLLVSNRDYLFVYPISIWIPVKKKTFKEVKIDLYTLAKKHGFEVLIDEVTKINSAENKVFLRSRELSYEYLVVAFGMSKIKMKGLEHTHSICGKPEEAEIIKDELDKLIKQGHGSIAVGFGSNPKDPTATSVRGGPAFELLFNFSHYLKKLKLRDQFDLTFFAPMAEPGKKMGDKPYKKMDVFFKHYNIDVKKGKKITHFEQGEVFFEDASSLKSDLIIFIPGGDGHPVLKVSDLPLSKAGFINIDEYCQVEDVDNVYAIGDVTTLRGPKWAAKQGHIAEVMADAAVYNIRKQIQGKEKRREYKKHLNIICVMDSGDGAAFIKRAPDVEVIVPLPILGHWLKKFWGFYYINSKLRKIPRLPGL